MLEIGCFFRVVREKRRNQAYSLPLKNNLSARSRPPVVRREVIWEMNVGLFRSSWTFSNPQPSPQGPPGAGELRADDANPATDIQELLPLKRPAPKFCQHEPCGSVRATASVAPQVALRHLAIELRLTSAIPRAARHTEHLDGPDRVRCYSAGTTDSTVKVSPLTVPFTVTFCAAYLSNSASWKNEWLNYLSQSLLCTLQRILPVPISSN